MKKRFNYKILNIVEHYNFGRGLSERKLFEKIKNLNLQICEFETLNNFEIKIMNKKM
jgi:hypothetical protein